MSRLTADAGDLKADVEKARRATDNFAAWLDFAGRVEDRDPRASALRTTDWYLKNVQARFRTPGGRKWR